MLYMFFILLSYLIIALFLICGLLLYVYLKKQYRYWKDREIPGPKPLIVYGNMKESFNLKCTEPEMVGIWYREYRNEPYIGFYNLWKPSILIIDPELIKKITEGDFHHFTDHPPISGESESDAVGDSLFTQKGAIWKVRRKIFSRLFKPRKIKDHTYTLKLHSSLLIKEIKKLSESSKDIELCNLIGKYVLRTVMYTLYGIDLMNDEQTFSELNKYSEMFLCSDSETVIKFLFFTVSPTFFKVLRLSTFPIALWKYFSSFTTNLLSSRSQEVENHEDLVSVVKQYLNSGTDTEFTSHEAVGHIFSFFTASHHTTLTTMSYALFLLGQYPDIQEKVNKEIDRVIDEEGNISYESINKMTYLDAVLNETLRLYPLLGVLKRICTENYRIDEKLMIPKCMDIYIPVEALHMDPEYFPEPEKFKPERFLDFKKIPSVFMPFGKGPRICIGMRMATVSFKITLANILFHYTVLPTPRSTLPVRYDVNTSFITCRPRGGLWVRMKKKQRPEVPLYHQD